MPIKVTFSFPQNMQHSFSETAPSVQINLVLNIQNLLQTEVCNFSCEIKAN